MENEPLGQCPNCGQAFGADHKCPRDPNREKKLREQIEELQNKLAPYEFHASVCGDRLVLKLTREEAAEVLAPEALPDSGDQSEPPPGYHVNPCYYDGEDCYEAWSNLANNNPAPGSASVAIAACWVHYDSHPGYREALAERDALQKRVDRMAPYMPAPALGDSKRDWLELAWEERDAAIEEAERLNSLLTNAGKNIETLQGQCHQIQNEQNDLRLALIVATSNDKPTVQMDESWKATIRYSPAHSFIVAVQFVNNKTGKVVVTRFDKDKLVFLGDQDELPTFTQEALVRLAASHTE